MADEKEKTPATPTPDTETKSTDSGLQHSQGGTTTRDDATDVGVPMLPGDPSEPVGPEDALGEGPKRGDYSDRIGDSNYKPTQSVPVPDAKDGEARAKIVDQAPRASEQGEEAGKKGGVDTSN